MRRMLVGSATAKVFTGVFACALVGLASIASAIGVTPKLAGVWPPSIEQRLAGASVMAVVGNRLYLAHEDCTMAIYDASDPAEIGKPLGSVYLEGAWVSDMAVYGNHVYLTSVDLGLQVVDISDPCDPLLLDYSSGFSGGECLAIKGNYLYLGNWYGDFLTFDITDPAEPLLVDSIFLGNTFDYLEIEDIEIDGNYAYLATGDANTLMVVDLSTPAEPLLVRSFDLGAYLLKLAVADNYLFVADYWDGVSVVDISNPLAPSIVLQEYDSFVVDMAVAGNYVFLIAEYDGLLVVDISDMGDPDLVYQYSKIMIDDYCDLAISGNTLYVSTVWSGLYTFDITTPDEPQKLIGIDAFGWPIAMAIGGEYAYLTDVVFGNLIVLDLSTPTTPELAAKLQLDLNDASSITLAGNYVLVSNFSDLAIVDISNPTAPLKRGTCGIDGYYIEKIAVSGNYAWLACCGENYSLEVADISDPDNPRIVKRLSLGLIDEYAIDLAIRVTTLFVAGRNGGDVAVDIADPLNPIPYTGYDISIATLKMAAKGDYAYLVDGYEGITILNIADPDNIYEVDTFTFGTWSSYYNAIHIQGNILFASHDGAVALFDLADPEAPFMICDSESLSDYTIEDIAVSSLIYTLHGSDGLRVLDLVPAPLNQLNTIEPTDDEWFQYPLVVGDLLFLTTEPDGYLQLIDVSNPVLPQVLGQSPVPMGIQVVVGNYAFGLHQDGLVLMALDISDPTDPTIAGSGFDLDPDGNAAISLPILAAGNYLYVNGSFGVKIIEISNPAAMTLAGIYPAPNGIWDSKVDSRGYLYFSQTPPRFSILDVRTPANIKLAATLPEDYQFFEFTIVGNYLYAHAYLIYSGETRLLVVDISDPYNPVIQANYAFDEPYYWVSDILAANNHLFLLGYGEIRVIDVTDPANPELVYTFPCEFMNAQMVCVDNLLYAIDDNYLRAFDITSPGSPVLITQQKTSYYTSLLMTASSSLIGCNFDILVFFSYVTPGGDNDRILFFDTNGGTLAQGNSYALVTYGQPYAMLPLPEPPAAGLTFEGWWLTPDFSGSQVTDASTVAATRTHTLYARWSDWPRLMISFYNSTTVELIWQSDQVSDYFPEYTEALLPGISAQWQTLGGTPSQDGREISLRVPTTGKPQCFFRLRKTP